MKQNKNIFNIEVVSKIPDIQRQGTIYINALKYTNEMPEDLPETFLLAGEHLGARYLEEGVNKDVVANVSLIHSIDSNKIFVTAGHPGYRFPIPEDPTRYYLDSTTNKLYTAVANPKVNGYKLIEGIDVGPDEGRPYVIYQDDESLPVIYVYTHYNTADGSLIDNIRVLYQDINEEITREPDNADYAPSTVVTVSSIDELHHLTPNFLGVYKVLSGEKPSFYLYNPYNLVEQEYFNFNCDVIY